MYERFEPLRWESTTYLRDTVIRWTQDISRTIDYLETRPDFDPQRIAFYGFSNGAMFAPVFTAIEPRIATSALAGVMGVAMLRPAQADLVPFRYTECAERIASYLEGRFSEAEATALAPARSNAAALSRAAEALESAIR
jgi:cephalosporin-C deacetylase-like acetyl esterase